MNSAQSWRRRLTPAVFALTLLAGCATVDDVPAIDWQHGARRAWVLSEYAPDIDAAQLPPCLAVLPAADYGRRHFMRVRYRHVRLMYEEVAELPSGLQAKAGDRVELWPANCEAGQLSRISRVF